MRVPSADPSRFYERQRDAILGAVDRVLSSGQYILGSEVGKFEHAVAEFLDVPHAIGVASGTDALALALRALNIGEGDAVITSPFTFFATCSAILSVGARPVFADVEPDSFNLDPQSVELVLEDPDNQARGADVRAVIPVHLFGLAADLKSLADLAGVHSLRIVEDAAQAFGSRYGSKQVGTIGDVGCFSFFPTKNLPGCGDGGLVVTADAEVAERVRSLRAHGQSERYHHVRAGVNSRLDAVQAAILGVRLQSVSDELDERRAIAASYTAAFDDLSGVTCPRSEGTDASFNQYTIRVSASVRDAFRAELLGHGVESAIYYPIPLHLQPAVEHLGYTRGDFPYAEQAAAEVVSLPIFPLMERAEIDHVVRAVRSSIKAVT